MQNQKTNTDQKGVDKMMGFIGLTVVHHLETGRKWGILSNDEGQGQHRVFIRAQAIGGLLREGSIKESEVDDEFEIVTVGTSMDVAFYRKRVRPFFTNWYWPIDGHEIVTIPKSDVELSPMLPPNKFTAIVDGMSIPVLSSDTLEGAQKWLHSMIERRLMGHPNDPPCDWKRGSGSETFTTDQAFFVAGQLTAVHEIFGRSINSNHVGILRVCFDHKMWGTKL